MTHKEWIDNEYQQWIKALQESTVNNFKEHPVVKRMLGEPDNVLFNEDDTKAPGAEPWETMLKIDSVGFKSPNGKMSAAGVRMVYCGCELMRRIYKEKISSICEIGGGVGQFYAILRALGYKGSYFIYNLPPVKQFQHEYLCEVERQTGLKLARVAMAPEMVVSFYALGEFDDITKASYKGLLSAVQRGYIVWNSHSGASDDLSLFKHDIKVTPGIEPGIKIIQW